MIEVAHSPDGKLVHATHGSDLRRHQRVKISMLGRYMLPDRREYPCQTVDMSPGGVRLICAVTGEIDDRVVLYLEHIGRIEGTIARRTTGGFAVRLSATPRKRDKIASQLTWLANREALGLPEGRTHERLTPLQTGVVLRLESGREVQARVIDVSMSGIALSTATAPTLGTSLMVGRTPGRVVRYFEGGIGVQFMLPISPDMFHEGLIF